MALDTCSSGHDEICFDYSDGCPVCVLHSAFDLSNNSDVGAERYKKCTIHDCYHLDDEDCPGCDSNDTHKLSCEDHDCSYEEDCPACEIEEQKDQRIEELSDDCSKLQEEIDNLRNTPKPEPKPVEQKRGGYEFF